MDSQEQETLDSQEQETLDFQEQETLDSQEQETLGSQEQETLDSQGQETLGSQEQETLDSEKEKETATSSAILSAPTGKTQDEKQIYSSFKKTSTTLHRCSCHKVSYCSAECQRLDWTLHKHKCTSTPNAGSKNTSNEAILRSISSTEKKKKDTEGIEEGTIKPQESSAMHGSTHSLDTIQQHTSSITEICSYCKKKHSAMKNRCGCGKVQYCGKECKAKHRKEHKLVCQLSSTNTSTHISEKSTSTASVKSKHVSNEPAAESTFSQEQETLDSQEQETLDSQEQETLDFQEQETLDSQEQETLGSQEQETLDSQGQETLGSQEQETLDSEKEKETATSSAILSAPTGKTQDEKQIYSSCKKTSTTLHRCSCHKVSYCSAECQRLDWTLHKHKCTSTPNAGSKNTSNEAILRSISSTEKKKKDTEGIEEGTIKPQESSAMHGSTHSLDTIQQHTSSITEICSYCKKKHSAMKNRCGCGKVQYCGKECKAKHRKEHKLVCQLSSTNTSTHISEKSTSTASVKSKHVSNEPAAESTFSQEQETLDSQEQETLDSQGQETLGSQEQETLDSEKEKETATSSAILSAPTGKTQDEKQIYSSCKKTSTTLHRCSCHKVSYCSAECQRLDWTLHKHKCTSTPNAGSKNTSNEAILRSISSTEKKKKDTEGIEEGTIKPQESSAMHGSTHSLDTIQQHTSSITEICSYCKKKHSAMKNRCGCGKVQYCGKECKAKHRKEHKLVCQLSSTNTSTHISEKSTSTASVKSKHVSNEPAAESTFSQEQETLDSQEQETLDSQGQETLGSQEQETLDSEKEKETATSSAILSAPTGKTQDEKQICSSCKKTSTTLHRCSCHKVSYCSAECQRLDWTLHKHKCTSPPNAGSKNTSNEAILRSISSTEKKKQDTEGIEEGTIKPQESSAMHGSTHSLDTIQQHTSSITEICSYCKKKHSAMKNRCGCGKVQYCGKECKAKHRKEHKLVCQLSSTNTSTHAHIREEY